MFQEQINNSLLSFLMVMKNMAELRAFKLHVLIDQV